MKPRLQEKYQPEIGPALTEKFGIKNFLKITQGDQDRDWDQDDVERLGRIYYEAYRDSAERLLNIVPEKERYKIVFIGA